MGSTNISDGIERQNQAYKALSDHRRRFALQVLAAKGPMSKEELARAVASRENNKPIKELTKPEWNRVRVALHQHHLEPLDGWGYVVWNEEKDWVSLGEDCKEALSLMNEGQTEQSPMPVWTWLAEMERAKLDS